MRTIVVTGASSGIGMAVADRFVADGEDVVLTGRRANTLETAADKLSSNRPGRARPVSFDAADPAGVEAVADRLPNRIDVLVNNAGGNTDFDRATPEGLAGTLAAWQANLDANLLSAVLVTTALQERLVSGGAVVSIGSIAADKGAGSYGAAKAALASWTVDLAHKLGPEDITANTVVPGYVADTEFFRDRLTDDRRQALVDASLVGRPSRPEDIAEVTHFLASSGARQITGQSVPVNGGERTTR